MDGRRELHECAGRSSRRHQWRANRPGGSPPRAAWLVAAAAATLVAVSGVRIVGLALVLTNITPAQQLESLNGILLSIIGTGTALILLPALFAGASVITTRISRGYADRAVMGPPRRRWSPASAHAPLRLR